MPYMFNRENVEFRLKESPLVEFAWHSSPMLSKVVHSKHLHFALRQLDPDKYSYPYHFHRNSEEVFVILSGTALRTPEKTIVVEIFTSEIGLDLCTSVQSHTRTMRLRYSNRGDFFEYPDRESSISCPNRKYLRPRTKWTISKAKVSGRDMASANPCFTRHSYPPNGETKHHCCGTADRDLAGCQLCPSDAVFTQPERKRSSSAIYLPDEVG